MTIIDQIEKEQLRSDLASFNIGDTVRVMVKVKEGEKERIQAYTAHLTTTTYLVQAQSTSGELLTRKLAHGIHMNQKVAKLR